MVNQKRKPLNFVVVCSSKSVDIYIYIFLHIYMYTHMLYKLYRAFGSQLSIFSFESFRPFQSSRDWPSTIDVWTSGSNWRAWWMPGRSWPLWEPRLMINWVFAPGFWLLGAGWGWWICRDFWDCLDVLTFQQACNKVFDSFCFDIIWYHYCTGKRPRTYWRPGGGGGCGVITSIKDSQRSGSQIGPWDHSLELQVHLLIEDWQGGDKWHLTH